MTIKLLCAGTALLLGCAVDNVASDERVADDKAATTTIHGTGTLYGHTATGIRQKPIDLSGNLFASYSGTPLVQELGAGTANGTFEVPVQAGAKSWDLETDVVFGSPYLVVGDARHPNVDQHVLGRLDGVAPTTETDVTLNVTGLDTWTDGDETELMVANNGDIVYAPETEFAAPPTDGDTTTTGTIDWSQQFPPAVLVNAHEGDIASLEQLIVRTSGSESYQALDRYATAAPFTQTDGAPSTVAFSLAPVHQESHAMRWRGAAFEAMASDVGVGATDLPGGQAVFIDALPGAAQFGFYTSAPDLAIYSPSVSASNLALTLDYGNPYHWDEFVSMNYLFGAPVALGDAAPTTIVVGYVANQCVTDTIAPELSPVRNATISGSHATWQAPALGHATEYFIQLEQLTASDGQTSANLVASFLTTARSLEIPSDFLTAGTYVLVITATNFGDVDRTTSLFGDGLPVYQAISVTPPFTVQP
jgi:hypothetical protein